jgi:hypothetical protein
LHKRYSPKALDEISAALKPTSVEEIWAGRANKKVNP